MARKTSVAASTKRWRKWYAKHGDPTAKQRREKWESKLGSEGVKKKQREYTQKYRKNHPNG